MPNSRLDKLLEMLGKQPDDPFLIYAVGIEYEAIGEVERAMDYYTTVLDRHPDYLPVYYQAGLLSSKMGDNENANALLEKGISLAQTQKDRKTENELKMALEDLED